MIGEYKLLIDGKWVSGKEVKETCSPYDQSVVGRVHFADAHQVRGAVDSAHLAFQKTKMLSSYERAKALEFVSDQIAKNKEELARSIVMGAGKTMKAARVEADRAVSTFQIASEEAKRMNGEIIPLDLSPQTSDRWGLVRRFPIGVMVGITPFNFPLNLVAHKVAPAMASGNTMLLRPASQVAMTSSILAEIIVQSDFPAGGFNHIPCGYSAADVFLEDDRIKKITFTGSPDIGWELKKRANKKRVTLELGGNAAVVIEPDANLDFALPRTVLGAYAYSGQICISIQRIFLHKKIYDRFMARFLDATTKLKIGNPMEESTDIGPMINLDAAKQTEEWLEEALANGARLLCGGKRDSAMFEPTILENVKPELRISCQEAFAPVVVVSPYEDFELALRSVNDSIYGLQAGVFTNDLKKAFQAYESLDVGGVICNDIPTFRIDHMPYGGVKESGFGREGLKYAIEEMTELKLLAVNLNI
ncbi:MAG: aldehyde dehydrogenase family protein [Candidatus Aminicenantes bacterium]|nr:MAG: aldehyde dehydrogenase family protein [Candidatus Aminicenantes bacterium]